MWPPALTVFTYCMFVFVSHREKHLCYCSSFSSTQTVNCCSSSPLWLMSVWFRPDPPTTHEQPPLHPYHNKGLLHFLSSWPRAVFSDASISFSAGNLVCKTPLSSTHTHTHTIHHTRHSPCSYLWNLLDPTYTQAVQSDQNTHTQHPPDISNHPRPILQKQAL